MLYPVGKQAYKFKLPKKWKIHDVFHLSLLEQDITKKERVEEVLELDAGNKDSDEYEMEAIRKSAVYANKSELGHLLGLYSLVV